MSTVVVVTSTAVAVAVSAGAKVIMNKRDRKNTLKRLTAKLLSSRKQKEIK